ncbi:MAG: sensor histidine kinase [Glaciimonas sp.]|nr:sensor histidine kinase [Glaciimonas sp.]
MGKFDEGIALYQKGVLPEVVQFFRFCLKFNRVIWISNIVNSMSLLILVIFYRLIQTNFAKQRVVENQLKLVNENLEKTVLARTRQLSILSHHLLKVSEEEKAKLARELHDEMGSALTVIGMTLSNVAVELNNSTPDIISQLTSAKEALQETVNLKRRIIENLRPSMLDNLGLAASIESHCENIAQIGGLTYETDISEDFEKIDPAWAIALFRITQESLNNVIKYAHASHVKISLKHKTSGLWLQILDDGVGIPTDALEKPKSHGLLGMRERILILGGTFSVQCGENNCGTIVEALIPFATSISD